MAYANGRIMKEDNGAFNETTSLYDIGGACSHDGAAMVGDPDLHSCWYIK